MKLFNKIGIIIAVFFGIVLVFVSAKENKSYNIETELIENYTIEKNDRVSAGELNEWIIEKNQKYMLIDIRSEKEFDKACIPSAENIPGEELVKKDIVSDLPKDIPIIIYSRNNSETKQGLVILKEAGFNVFLLEGGYEFWKDYPSRSKSMSNEDFLVYKKELSAANFLKGIVSSDVAGTELIPPKKKKTRKKKRKKKNKLEGC